MERDDRHASPGGDGTARTSVLPGLGDAARPGRDALVGRTVEGRYVLTGTIASGGMATVYLAVDRRLEREVAVKVMHASLAHDPDFVARFEREAKAAASINHANVVTVTDTGVDGDLVFLVMELVRGRTLRDLLHERGRLSPTQALEVVEPVLTALAAAARAGIVHRDVKPENVLLGDEGVIKVADFGLARAIEASALTSNTGLLLGTVAYLPPERAKGGASDARGDVYATGVVLFELLTGSAPFEAETPLAVAYRHVHESVPAPSTRVGGIPPAVDALVARATGRDPGDRYPDAATFLADVRRVRAQVGASPARRGDTLAIPLTEHLTEALDAVPPPRAPRQPRAARRRRRWPLVLALLVLLSALAGGLGWWYGRDRTPHVPGFGTRDLRAYEQALDAHHLAWRVGPGAPSDTVTAGLVLATLPAPGAAAKKGTTVVITPSSGVLQVKVPDVAEASTADATTALTQAGLTVGGTAQAYSDTVAAGTVVSTQPPAGTTIDHRTKVTLTVSQGPAPVAVPDVRGKPLDQAQATLTAIGVRSTVAQAFSDTVAAGTVISQTPPPGAGHRGETVALTVSKGPQTVAVPSLASMSGAQARAALQAAGLVPDEHDLFGYSGQVVGPQSPKAGTTAKVGSKVTFYTA